MFYKVCALINPFRLYWFGIQLGFRLDYPFEHKII